MQTIELQQPEADLEIYESVIEAIEGDNVVRESRVPFTVSVEKGAVTVKGVVLNEMVRRRVLYAAATVPGVEKVIDRLYSDADIERAVARALAADPALKGIAPAITVTSYGGIVTLHGTVTNPDEKTTAVRLASATVGVYRVDDHLEIEQAQ